MLDVRKIEGNYWKDALIEKNTIQPEIIILRVMNLTVTFKLTR